LPEKNKEKPKEEKLDPKKVLKDQEKDVRVDIEESLITLEDNTKKKFKEKYEKMNKD
jgi:hypothetical protein